MKNNFLFLLILITLTQIIKANQKITIINNLNIPLTLNWNSSFIGYSGFNLDIGNQIITIPTIQNVITGFSVSGSTNDPMPCIFSSPLWGTIIKDNPGKTTYILNKGNCSTSEDPFGNKKCFCSVNIQVQ